jgi:hypothetical protein
VSDNNIKIGHGEVEREDIDWINLVQNLYSLPSCLGD